jgi:hypothetical protein
VHELLHLKVPNHSLLFKALLRACLEQLDVYVRANPTLHYEQIEDIDLSGYTNWEPLPEFSGVFDGKGYTISNLTIDSSGSIRVGLFSKQSDGVLKSIKLEGVARF